MITRATAIRSRLAKKKQGFTLTEIAIVLGVIGLILGAIWTAAASVYANQRTAHANTAILQIAQGVRTLYSTSSDMTTGGIDITSALHDAGVIPTDMAMSGSDAIGPFPNGTTGVLTDTDTPPVGFLIEMTGVPKASCVNLLTQIGGNSRDAGLFEATAVTTAAIATTDAVATGTPLTASVTPSDAAGSCNNDYNKTQVGFTLK